jgi:SAM-dependent methyltransferase
MSTTAAATDPLRTSYEETPYESRAITVTHPSRLAAVAALYGFTAQSPARSRVLEIGCAAGGNILAMAATLPDSTFVGVDFAHNQIEAGRLLAVDAGLRNVELLPISITEIDDSFGAFDYVICHGVYSWVPPAVQEAILRVCARNLSANGLAYVSYNTYPGWHLRGLVREMIMYHDDPALSPRERVDRGRGFVEMVGAVSTVHSSVFEAILREEVQILRSQGDAYFLHEQLEQFNQPMRFFEFVGLAERAGLAFVAEAQLSGFETIVPDEALTAIAAWATDRVRHEQYLDYLRLRAFRRTLLCHAAAAESVSPRPTPDGMYGLHLLARADPLGDPAADGSMTYGGRDGLTVTTNNPLVCDAFRVLREVQPRSMSFEDLWSAVRPRSAAGAVDHAADPMSLAAPLLHVASARMVELHAIPIPVAPAVTGRPLATGLARAQARAGTFVTNLRHVPVDLPAIDKFVLTRLDGMQDALAIGEALRRAIETGEVGGEGLSPVPLAEVVGASFARLYAASLLLGDGQPAAQPTSIGETPLP